MANRKVTVMLRIRTSDGKRPFVKPAYAGNGRLKPLYALIGGNPQHHPEGVYHLRYAEGDRRVWEPVGTDPHAALTAKLRREHYLKSVELGLATNDPDKGTERIPLEDAVKEYIADISARKSLKTARSYTYLLKLFAECCKKKHLDEVERRDLLEFTAYLRAKKLADRTVHNYVTGMVTFFRANGIKGLLNANDIPKYTEKVVTAYNKEEVRRLFAAATAEERLAYQFFLYSGAREQEVQYATWRDVNFEDKTFTVRAKSDLGFTPKDYEERTVPLPDALIISLKERRKQYQDARLIFTNRDGNPEGHFLRKLQTLALRGSLNCGHCYNKAGLCCKSHPVCDNWELHKFRKTFATMHHESGVAARTLQAWLGHSDLETTLAYLAVADVVSERTREQVNRTFGFIL